MQVSVIIVNYNTRALLKDCIESIYRHTEGIDFEIIVSDNGSADGSIEMLKTFFPQVILIENNANIGFGAANNRGLQNASGKYVFYLNSDTILCNNAVKLFYDYWENAAEADSIGSLGCNLMDSRRRIIHSYGSFPSFKQEIKDKIHAVYGTAKLSLKHAVNKKQELPSVAGHMQDKKLGTVDYVTGADLFLKNNRQAQFDERYFMYCEDVDLAYQLCKNGKKNILIDGPEIIHLAGSSSEKKYDELHKYASFSNIYCNISRLIFFKKNGMQNIQIGFLKLLILLLWCNPYLYPKTKKYISKMLSA